MEGSSKEGVPTETVEDDEERDDPTQPSGLIFSWTPAAEVCGANQLTAHSVPAFQQKTLKKMV